MDVNIVFRNVGSVKDSHHLCLLLVLLLDDPSSHSTPGICLFVGRHSKGTGQRFNSYSAQMPAVMVIHLIQHHDS